MKNTSTIYKPFNDLLPNNLNGSVSYMKNTSTIYKQKNTQNSNNAQLTTQLMKVRII